MAYYLSIHAAVQQSSFRNSLTNMATLDEVSIDIDSFFFFLRKFQHRTSALDDALYHQTKTPIGFWYRRGLNSISLIQPLETLSVELTGKPTHGLFFFIGKIRIIIDENGKRNIQCVP